MQNVIPNLLTWYQQVYRKLPWRENVTPYQIWVSEIILQQTRVDQGGGYFLKFVDKFPNISTLAAAKESEILKIWQGLGYYARARNMHAAAKQLVNQFHSELPADYEKLRSLKGIGDYTAAAIASFAFQLPHAAIDGNVKRVSARFFGIDLPINSPKFFKMVQQLLDAEIVHTQPDTFNQAMIELGATLCTPTKPNCEKCPINSECFAFQYNRISDFPVVVPKNKPTKKYLHFFRIEQDGKLMLVCRPSKGIWGGLHEFPSVESDSLEEFPSEFIETLGIEPSYLQILDLADFKHLLTHQTIFARCWHLSSIPNNIVLSKSYFLVNSNEIRTFPMHKLMLKILNHLQL